MQKLKALLVVLLLSFLLSGCASFFTIGHESFKCEGDGEGGKCSNPMDIYANRKAILQNQGGQETDSKDTTPTVKQTSSIRIDQKAILPKLPTPVRMADDIRRICITPFESADDMVVGNPPCAFWVFTVVQKGKWVYPDFTVK